MSSKLEILTNKLNERLTRGKAQAQPYLTKLEEDGRNLNDYTLTLGQNPKLSFFREGGEDEKHIYGNPALMMKIQNGSTRIYSMHSNAIVQAGTKMGVPTGYMKDLAYSNTNWKVDLASDILNRHVVFGDRERVLVREVNGEIRGILSDRYRRLNQAEIYARFAQAMASRGMVIYDAYYDDLKSWMEAVYPEIMQVPISATETEPMVFGMRLSNSDFGTGSLELRMFMVKVVCLNGMVRDSFVKEIHLGSRLPDNIKLSDKTYKLDTDTRASLISDILKDRMTSDMIEKYSMEIQDANNMKVNFEQEFVQLPKLGVLKEEVKEVQEVIQSGREEDGVNIQGSTLWKLVNGITAVANSKNGTRMRDLQEVAGKLMDRVSKTNIEVIEA